MTQKTQNPGKSVQSKTSPSELSIQYDNYPASKKVYIQGSRPDIQVPVREITLSPTTVNNQHIPNAPLNVYDTSGPYTDPLQKVDLSQGIVRLRENWITERNDVEKMSGFGSDYQKERSHAHQMLMVDSDAAEDEMLNAPAQQGYEPEEEVSDSMMMAQLTDSIAKLPERDQVIMALYYNEEMNLKEIGAVLDISESRVSQLLSANVQKLRKMMALVTD